MSAHVSFVVYEVALGDLEVEGTIWKWILEATERKEGGGGSPDLEHGLVADHCEHDIKFSDIVKGGKSID